MLDSGWPFLTGAAFQDKSQNKVNVVIMNEATQDTKITLQDSKKGTWMVWHQRTIHTDNSLLTRTLSSLIQIVN